MHEDPALRNLPPTAEATQAGHEVADITLGGIRNFLIILFGTLLITFVLMAGLLVGMVKFQGTQDPEVSPLITEVPVPPEPQLQPSRYHNTLDAVDLASLHQQEHELLNSSAWFEGKQTARIPLAQAMDIVLSRGVLKVRSGSSNGSVGPTPTGGAAGLMINAANPLTTLRRLLIQCRIIDQNDVQ